MLKRRLPDISVSARTITPLTEDYLKDLIYNTLTYKLGASNYLSIGISFCSKLDNVKKLRHVRVLPMNVNDRLVLDRIGVATPDIVDSLCVSVSDWEGNKLIGRTFYRVTYMTKVVISIDEHAMTKIVEGLIDPNSDDREGELKTLNEWFVV